MDEAMDDAMDDTMASGAPSGTRWRSVVARRALSPSDPAVLVADALMALLAYLPTSLRWLNLPLVLCGRGNALGWRSSGVDLAATSAPRSCAGDSRCSEPEPVVTRLGSNPILTLVLVPLVSLATASTGLRLTHHTVTVGLSVTMLVFAGFEFVRRSRNRWNRRRNRLPGGNRAHRSRCGHGWSHGHHFPPRCRSQR